MMRILSAGIAIIFLGCAQPEVVDWVRVGDSPTVSEQQMEAVSLPRYIPEGSRYEVPAVGFEDSDGTFFPVLPLCRPVPRGGSVSAVTLSDHRLKVYYGRDPIAENNELLGIFEFATTSSSDLEIAFAIQEDGGLHLAVSDEESGRLLVMQRVTSETAAISSDTQKAIAQTSGSSILDREADDETHSL